MTIDKDLVTLVGKAITIPQVDHKTKNETFYSFILQVPRKSGTCDELPIIISENFVSKIEMDKNIIIRGQIRTYNDINKETKKRSLLIYVFVNDVDILTEANSLPLTTNEVELTGFTCKEPIHRHTPFGRTLADLLLAVNDKHKNSYYIPCIAWGRQANFVKDLPVGTHLSIKARFQSREYNKVNKQGESYPKVAYELSINEISVITSDNE